MLRSVKSVYLSFVAAMFAMALPAMAAPALTSINPTSGYPGTQVTYTGTGFGATQGTGSVWLGNKLAGSIVSWSNTQIVAVVAATAASGSAQVQQGGVWSNSIAFTVIKPNITSISPTSAYPGNQVTINGTNFGASQGSGSVWLGNKLAGSIVSWSDTQIVTVVAATALSGSCQVQQNGVWGNSVTFTVIQPNITSISPTSGYPGNQVTINGTNFGASQGSGSVWLGNKLAGSIVSWTSTQIVATVASTAASGNAIVQQGGVWSNSIAFTVITPSLTSASPTTARAGDSITLTGTNFGASQGTGSVWLGSKLAGSIVSWTSTQIVATVASGAVTGNAIVQQGGVWSNSIALTVLTPSLTSISPTTARAGDEITLTGTNFGATQGSGSVWLGSKLAGSIVSWSETQIVATVASGSIPGTAQVQQGGVWSNSIVLDVVIPVVFEISPESGETGTDVTIEGTGFGSVQGSGLVWIGTKYAEVQSWSDMEIEATVADDAESGGAQVFQNGVWSNAVDFEVEVPPPCGPPAPADVSGQFNATDVVFFEDELPAGTVVGAPGIVWDTNYHAGGTQAFTHASPDFAQTQTISLTGFNPAFWANRSDNLFVWVLIDGCQIPQQLKVTWKTSLGDKVVTYGNGFFGGNMPQPGQWTRLSVNLNSLNFHYGYITGVVLENTGGHVWWDHVGRSIGAGCLQESWQNRPNTRLNDDELWIDEDFPAGATVDAPGLVWSDRQRSTGDLSFNYPSLNSLEPQHISVQAFAPIEIDPDGFIFAYIIQNRCNPPEQVVLTWETSAGPRSAYWGANPYNSTGADMGPLPRTGFWERLEVPASLLGIEEGDTVTGFTIDQYGGHAFYDTIGARPECIQTEAPAIDDFEPGDVVWVDDTTPVGVVAHDLDFVTEQKTSGTVSFTSSDPDPAGTNTLSFDFPANFFDFVEGDSIVLYALLDPCDPPRQLSFRLKTLEFDSDVTFGDPLLPVAAGEDLPLSGVWQRVELPLGVFGNDIVAIEITTVDGRAWFDRLGKNTP